MSTMENASEPPGCPTMKTAATSVIGTAGGDGGAVVASASVLAAGSVFGVGSFIRLFYLDHLHSVVFIDTA